MTRAGDPGRGRRTGYKPTRAERELRWGQVHAMLVAGLSRKDICRYVSEKTTWGLTERSVERYIAQATKMVQASAAFDRDLELGKAIAGLNDLYSRAHRVQDYKTCLATQKELNELLGLYAAKRLEIPEGDGPSAFIAIFPSGPQDNQAWSQQAKAELAARQQQQEQEERERQNPS